jgi:hypothetical protein
MKKEVIFPVLIAIAVAIGSPAQLFGQNTKAVNKEKKEKVDTLKKAQPESKDVREIPATPAIPAQPDHTGAVKVPPVAPAVPDNTRVVPEVPHVPANSETLDRAVPAVPPTPQRNEGSLEREKPPVLSKPRNDKDVRSGNDVSVPPGQVNKNSDDRVKGYEKTSETGRKEGWDKDRDVRTNERMSINEKEHQKAHRKAEKKRAKELRKTEKNRLKALQKARNSADKK